MKSSKLITGVLIGAAAGAVLGILFAPDKGSKTRKKIMDGGADLKDSLKDKINEFVDEIVTQYETVKSKGEEMIEDGKEKAAAVKEEIKHSLS